MENPINPEVSLQTKLERYRSLKASFENEVLIFRASSTRPFYEAFGSDAKQISDLLSKPMFLRKQGLSHHYLFFDQTDMEKLQSISLLPIRTFDYPNQVFSDVEQAIKEFEEAKFENKLKQLNKARQKEQQGRER
ncbi:MAG: hypothetical protein ACPGJS_16775 [Flammeovirgaceae bacterium]